MSKSLRAAACRALFAGLGFAVPANAATPEELNAALHTAINENKLDALKAAITAGADVDAPDATGCPPLHSAVEFKRLPLVEALLAAGAKIDSRDSNQATPLHVAATWGWAEIASVLLAHQADPNARDQDGATPLFCLSGEEVDAIGDVLLAAGAEVHATNAEGNTALHAVAHPGYVEAVKYLLAHQADPARKNSQGRTPIDLAIKAGNYAAARVLLEIEGGQANVTAIDEPGPDGRADLHHAAMNGDMDTVTFLLNAGATVDVRDGEGATPLAYAAAMGEEDIISFLLDHGADINAQLKTGMSAVDIATSRKQDSTRQLLEARGGRDGRTIVITTLTDAFKANDAAKVGQLMDAYPELAKFNDLLTTAAELSDAAVIEMLLAKGCAVDLANADGSTALHTAAFKNRPEIVRVLLAHQADVQARDRAGFTVLHSLIIGSSVAADEVHVENIDAFLANAKKRDDQAAEIAQLLIAAGADINARTTEGETPLDVAMDMGAFAMIDLLRAKQAQGRPSSSEVFEATRLGTPERLKKLLAADRTLVNFRDELGRTPVVYAADYGSLDSIKVLLDARADINAANTKGETALHIAARKGDKNIVEFLVTKKTTLNARTKDEQTPLDYANAERTDAAGKSIETERSLAAKREISALLRKKGAKPGSDLGPMPAQ